MNTPQQKAPLPAPMMPWGFTGEWEPPAEYGDLTSPSIVPTAANWPSVPTPPQEIAPAFTTTTGQTLNTGSKVQFVFFGTWGKDANGDQGYLKSPYDQANTYGYPPGTHSLTYAQDEAANNWQQSPSQFIPVPPPGPAPAITNAALRDQAMALLAQMKF